MLKLPEFIANHIDPDFELSSRIHLLNQPFQKNTRVYIKREDELSSGISGSKYRKFASLIPFFLKNNFDEIAIIGSPQSNNVVAALQLLNENKMEAKLFLLQSHEPQTKGNLTWIAMLHDISRVVWIKREDWPNVNAIVDIYRESQRSLGRNVYVLNEGGCNYEAIPGAMSLAWDISENESKKNIQFSHIFMDSGTGVSAIGLILGLAELQSKANIYITLIAGNKVEFQDKLHKFKLAFLNSLNRNGLSKEHENLFFLKPVLARSFGSINNEVLTLMKEIAIGEGIIMEPVYSIKHYATMKKTIDCQNLTGDILFIYNGGSFPASGFLNKFTVNIQG